MVDLRIHVVLADERHPLADRLDGAPEREVVRELDRRGRLGQLPGAEGPLPHCLEERQAPFDRLGRAAGNDSQRALLRGLRPAQHGRGDEGLTRLRVRGGDRLDRADTVRPHRDGDGPGR